MNSELIGAVCDDLEVSLSAITTSKSFVNLAYAVHKFGWFDQWNALAQPQKTTLKEFLGERSFDIESVNRGLFALVSAAFEAYVRGLVSAAVQELGKKYKRFDDLPTKLRNRNYIVAGRALQTVASPRESWALDFGKLALDIGSCVPGQESFRLSSDAFAIQMSTMTSESIGEAFDELGIGLDWGAMAREPGIAKLVAGDRNAAEGVKNRIDDFIRKRNKIVHTTIGVPTVTLQELEETVTYIKAIALAIAKQVDRKIKAL